jgi:phage shock protein PspC (stress-responsive transcriptional regulator)
MTNDTSGDAEPEATTSPEAEPAPEPPAPSGAATSSPTSPAPGEPPSPPPPRRLTRSRTDRMIGGVAGGLADYFDLDPVLIRLAWVALVIFAGTGILLYIIAWVIIPEEPLDSTGQPRSARPPSAHAASGTSGAVVLAVILIVIGTIALLRSIDVNVPSWDIVLSAALVLVGVGLIAQARRGVNGGLIAIGVFLTLVLSAASGVHVGVDVDADTAFGDETAAPRTAATLEESYSHAFGSFTLDLGDLDISTLPAGTTRIEVDVAFGSVQIRHGGLPVRVEADSTFGSSEDYESPEYDDADRRILVEVSTTFGSSDVGR